MAIDFMSTQTGGEGETIQAVPNTIVDAQQFNVDIPTQEQAQPSVQQEQPQQPPVAQQPSESQVQQEQPQATQVNPYEELGLQDAGVELPEYATAQEIDIKKPNTEVVVDTVEVPDVNSSFLSETSDGEIIVNPSVPNPMDQPAPDSNDKFEYEEQRSGTTVDGETIINPYVIDTQSEEQAIEQEYKDTPIKLKHSRVMFNKPKGEDGDGDKPKKPKKDGIYKLSWQPEAVFKKEGDVWYKSLDEGKNYFKIDKGDVKKRYAVLESQAEIAESKTLSDVKSVIKPTIGNVKTQVANSDVTMGGNKTVSKNITYRDLTKPKIGTETDRYNKDGTVNFNYNPDVAEASAAAQVLIKKSEEGRNDGYYTFPDRDDAIFKKEKGEWYVDTTKTGKEFKPLTGENIPAREKVLEARAIPRIESLVNLTTTPSIKSVVKGFETGTPALVIENQKAVQALNANASWDKIAEVDQKATALKSSFEDALNFADTAIYDQVKDKLTNDQKDNLVNLQKDIKEIIGDGEYTDIKAKKVAELLKSGEQFFNDSMKVNEVVNEAYSAGVSIDRLNFEKKQKSFEQDYDLKASTESDRIGAEMFKSLSNMTNFILENADTGKINIDKNTGEYSFTDRVSLRERQYIESKLKGYLDEYENIQSQRYAEVRDEIENNKGQKKVTETNISRLKSQLNSAEVKSNPDLYRKTQQMLETEQNKLSFLDKEIANKQLSSNTVFLTEPRKVAQAVAGTITGSAKSSFNSVPKGLGPKQKFDLFYQNLQDKNKQLAIDNDINYSGLDLIAMRTKDVLDWKGFYSLNDAEREYLKNKATLNSLKSLYYNNDNGFTSDSAGFWESFINGFSNMLMPTMSAADGYQLETDKAQQTFQTLQEQGFSEKDLATPETLQKIKDRQTTDFWSKESFGKMTGTSVAFMGILMATSELPGAALKSLATAEKLITGAKDIAQVTKLANGIQTTYNEVLGLTKFGRFLKPAIQEGINFEIGGTVVQSAKDELDFTNGLVGGVFGEAFSAALGKMEKTQVINYMQAIFGDKTGMVVNTIKKTGRLASRGIGETAQETGEELGSIYSQSSNFKELMDNANKSFGTFDKVQEFVIASFILGTAFGVVQGNKAKDVYDNLPEGKRRQVDDLLSSIQSDINTAQNATEEYADDKLEEQENRRKAEENDKENKQGVPSEVGEGQKPQQTESITETSQEEVNPSGVVQEEQTVEGLRAEEQAELVSAIPNIEEYKVDGEIDKSLMTPEDLAKYDEIYAKYDGLITPLMETTETTAVPTTEKLEKPKTVEEISVDIESAITDNPGVMDKIKATLGGLIDFDKGPRGIRTTKIGKKVKQGLESSTIADLYLQAKEDGSNPALVNEIEKIIMPKTELSADVEQLQESESDKVKSAKLRRSIGGEMTEDESLKSGSPDDELGQNKEIERLSNTILDIARKSPARITPEGKIQGGMINLMSNIQKADAKPNVSKPSTISFLPQTITLKHLARSVNDLNSILKNGFNSDKVSIDSPIPGVYFSSEDWSTMDRFGRGSDNALFVDIDNKDLLYFDSPSDFGDFLRENNLPDRGVTLNKDQVEVLKNLGVKGILLREDYASQSRNELIVIDDSIIKDISKDNKEITQLPSSFSDPKLISEAYIKAKADGSNPELVKIVDDFISSEQSNQPKEEGTVSEKAKSFAEKIRSGKIDTKGLAMSSVPGLNEAWNASLEVAAVTVEAAGEAADAIGKGIAAAEKSFKESEFYKSLQTREERLRYFNDLRNNIEQALTEEKMTGKEKSAAREFGQTVNEVTGVKPAPKMITAKESDLLKARIKAQAASSRDTAKNLNNMKEEVRKFAKENLPKDVYTAREVGAVLSAITKAKTEKSVNDAIDKIQALSERKVEAARVAKAKDIAKTIKSKKTLYSKINDKWKGKVSVEAQQEFKDFIESLTDLESMSMDELQAVEETIDGILNEGKADLKRVKEIQDSKRRTENAKMLEELGGTPRVLTDVAAINEFFDSVGGHVIVDGQLYNKSDFAKSAYNNKTNPATLNEPAKGYDKTPADQARVISEETTSTAKKAGRWIKKASTLESIYGQFQKIYKGSPELKKFIEENISQPIKDYFVDSKIAKGKIFKEFRDGRAKIFGSQKNAAKILDAHADVNPIIPMANAGLKVKNTVLVSLYNLGKLTDGRERLIESKVDVDMLNEYIENNSDLKEYSDFLIDQYASLKERYEPTYISIMNTQFPEGIYYPAYAASGPIQDTFNETDIFDGSTNEFKALNAMVDNLKQRTNYKGPFNTTLTAEEIFSDYVNNMERAKALVPVAKSLNQLFNEANRPYIANKVGYKELSNLQRHLAIILTGKKASAETIEAIDTLMNWNVISTLGFKIASIPKQLASITHFWSAGIKHGLNPARIITSVPATREEWQFLKEIMGSEYLKERLSGSGLDVEVQRILATKTDRQYKKAVKKIFQVGMYLPAAGDWLTITFPLGGGGSYAIAALRNELSKGKSLEEAKDTAFKQFVEAVEETQQTSREDYTSNFQRNQIGRMILTYKSAQVGAARKITEGMRTLMDAKNAKNEDKIQAFADIIYYSAFSSVLFNLISNAGYDVFTNPLYDDDDEKRVKYDLFMDQAGSVAQGFGFIGMIIDWTLNASRDDIWKNNAPFIQFMANVANGAASFMKALSKKEYSDLTEEEQARMLEELGLPQGYLTDDQLEELFEVYRNTSVTQRMSPQEINNLIKIFGVKNIVEEIKDFTDAMEGNQSFMDAFMNYEQDYFEFAKKRNKEDYLFKYLYNEDYLKKTPRQNKVDTYEPVIINDKRSEVTREGVEENW